MKEVARNTLKGVTRTVATLVACALALVLAAPSRALAAGEQIEIGQTFATKGIVPDDVTGTFDYELTAVGEAPLPGGAEGTYAFSITGDDSLVLPILFGSADNTDALVFPHAGVFEYDVTCTSVGDERLAVDNSSYHIYVSIFNDDTAPDKLVVDKIVVQDNDNPDYKPDEIAYEHSYQGSPFSVTVDNPPVVKVVSGNTPSEDATWHFRMKADDASNPMPSGSKDGAKTVQIKGEGQVEIGEMTFTEEGTYTYTLTELNDGVANYEYDGSVYKLTFEVVDNDGNLVVTRTITKDGKAFEDNACTFTNKYSGKNDIPRKIIKRLLPKTGDQNWGLVQLSGALLVAGGVAIGMGIANKRRQRKSQE